MVLTESHQLRTITQRSCSGIRGSEIMASHSTLHLARDEHPRQIAEDGQGPAKDLDSDWTAIRL
jgi:hypothetical protein